MIKKGQEKILAKMFQQKTKEGSEVQHQIVRTLYPSERRGRVFAVYWAAILVSLYHKGRRQSL